MTYIHRNHEPAITQSLYDGKIAVIYGPRQVGKTTMARNIAESVDPQYLYLNCDEPDVASALSNKTSVELALYIGASKMIIIDEAQRVNNIGITLKLLADNYKDLKIIATGSSSFELANSINEPLTGRAYYYYVWPLSVNELPGNDSDKKRQLAHSLVYGQYPVIALNLTADKDRYMANLTQNYLYRDLLNAGVIRSEAILIRLLQLLALQIGSQVSMNELANNLGIDVTTVRRLIDLLEKAFVIHTLKPYSTNNRKTIRKQTKIYFVDLGVRNTLIGNLNSIDKRDDKGALWENFCVNELRKHNMLLSLPANDYFWRDYIGAEVDYLQEKNGQLTTYEFKWSASKNPRLPKAFVDEHGSTDLTVINSENFVSKLG